MLELIVNPTAGGGRAREIADAVCTRLKERAVEFMLHVTEHPGHATEIARQAAARGAKTVIAFGGDGTVTETAAGLHGTQTALGIIPSGTGNDFIKSAAIPAKWEEALEFIFSHPARPVNSGLVNGRLFLNECGTGFDVMTLDFANKARRWIKGKASYLVGVAQAVVAFRPIEMQLKLDDGTVLDGKYMVCAVGNGRYIGGGIPITPCAELSDGQLELLMVDAVPNWVIPYYLPFLLMGTLYKKKKVAHCYKVKECWLKCRGMRLNIDGEIEAAEEAHFVCEENKLLLHW